MSIGFTVLSVAAAFVCGFWLGHYRGWCDGVEAGWKVLVRR